MKEKVDNRIIKIDIVLVFFLYFVSKRVDRRWVFERKIRLMFGYFNLNGSIINWLIELYKKGINI